EIDKDRIDRLQRDDRGAGREVLAEVDLADAEPAGEWRHDRLLIDLRADQLDLRRRLFALGGGGVEIGLGHVAALRELLRADEVELFEAQIGDRRLELRA